MYNFDSIFVHVSGLSGIFGKIASMCCSDLCKCKFERLKECMTLV